MVEEAERVLAAAWPRIHGQQGDLAARSEALYGAWLCGTCLGAVGMALHHKICHTLGGAFGLSHAETHAVMLPHALAYNLSAARAATPTLPRPFNAHDPPLPLFPFPPTPAPPRPLRA